MPLHNAIRQGGLFAPGDRILCALSGGPDSVCMTHVLCAMRKELSFEVAAAHFSHGLRPQEAERERAFSEELCKELNIPFFCAAGDTPAYAQKRRIGTEEAARTLRYAFLDRTADAWGATHIATAHTQNDQTETVLFHLIRGSGARGLSGIPVSRGRYVRPLLDVSRAEVEAYLSEHGLGFVVDESNFDLQYARNRLRREILPLLENVHPGALKSIASAASLLASDDDCLQQAAAALTEGDSASASKLARAHPAIAGRAVQRMYRMAGGRADLYRRQTESVLQLCASEKPSAVISLPEGFIARREYDKLFITASFSGTIDPPEETALILGKTVRFGEWELMLHQPAADGFAFPADALSMPLTVRTRQTGDCIALPGGSKSLKKWMIDQKIPCAQRACLPVICDGRRVLAVANLVKAQVPGSGEEISISCRRITI